MHATHGMPNAAHLEGHVQLAGGSRDVVFYVEVNSGSPLACGDVASLPPLLGASSKADQRRHSKAAGQVALDDGVPDLRASAMLRSAGTDRPVWGSACRGQGRQRAVAASLHGGVLVGVTGFRV